MQTTSPTSSFCVLYMPSGSTGDTFTPHCPMHQGIAAGQAAQKRVLSIQTSSLYAGPVSQPVQSRPIASTAWAATHTSKARSPMPAEVGQQTGMDVLIIREN